MGVIAGGERPPRREEPLPVARRAGSFLAWWVGLMAFWVWIDDTLARAELLVGAGVAVMGALFAETVQHQAGTYLRVRFEWFAYALPIPMRVVRDLGIIFHALWRRIVAGESPSSSFEEVPMKVGGQTSEEVTRRALVVAGTSIAPNTFVLGIDEDRSVMLVHRLVGSDAQVHQR